MYTILAHTDMYSYVSISDNLLSCTSTCSLAYSPLTAYQRWTLKDAIFANNDKIIIVVVLQLKKCIAQYENIHYYITVLLITIILYNLTQCHCILNIPVPVILCVVGILGGWGWRKLLTGGKPGMVG